MELNARVINKSDWDMLLSWWAGHGWPTPKKDNLPETRIDIDPQSLIQQAISEKVSMEVIEKKPYTV